MPPKRTHLPFVTAMVQELRELRRDWYLNSLSPTNSRTYVKAVLYGIDITMAVVRKHLNWKVWRKKDPK